MLLSFNWGEILDGGIIGPAEISGSGQLFKVLLLLLDHLVFLFGGGESLLLSDEGFMDVFLRIVDIRQD